MNLIQAIILGIVQGVTEFAPVSSSAHLVLVPWAFGWPSPGVAFDTILHWGTLTAVMIYFWRRVGARRQGFLPQPDDARGRGTRNRAAGSPTLTTGWPGGSSSARSRPWCWASPSRISSRASSASPLAVGALLLVTALILVLGEQAGRRVRDAAAIVGQYDPG